MPSATSPPPITNSWAINSSALTAAAYDDERRALQVEFRDGTVYQYFDVPRKDYQDLCQAESKGLYFNRHIRNRFASTKLATPSLG
jgi:hypothetical protein